MSQDATPLVRATVVLRDDLTMMVQAGEQVIEVMLAPKDAIGLGVDMIITALGASADPQEIIDAGRELIMAGMLKKARDQNAVLARHDPSEGELERRPKAPFPLPTDHDKGTVQ